MKIVVASEGKNVSEHFSKCEGFRVYEFEGETIHVHDYLENDGTLGNYADLFESMGVSTIIAGGIGEGQLSKLEGKGLWVFKGIQGEVSEAILKLKQGMLISDPTGDEPGHSCGGGGCGSHGSGDACGCSTQSSGGCGCGNA